jgi:hypothetical protein
MFKPHSKFTEEEDRMLRHLVSACGTQDWNVIAGQIGSKSARQCKERWANYLRPDLRLAPWTREEDSLLLEKYRELGPRWVTISTFFSDRTDGMLKNRFNRIRRWGQRSQTFLSQVELAWMLPNETKPLRLAQSSVDLPDHHGESALTPETRFATFDDAEQPPEWPESFVFADDIASF